MALHFELVTPERLVRSDEVFMVVVPGTEGEEGVLAGHAPYMTTMKDGALKIYKNEIASKHAHIATIKGDLSEPYKRIKDECNFPRKIQEIFQQCGYSTILAFIYNSHRQSISFL